MNKIVSYQEIEKAKKVMSDAMNQQSKISDVSVMRYKIKLKNVEIEMDVPVVPFFYPLSIFQF